MNKKELILIGGGGHCKSCIDVIEQENKYTIAGIVDIKEKIGQTILGYPIIGTDDDLSVISQKYDHFLITIGQLKNPSLRIKLFKKIKDLNGSFPVIISPNAYVSKHAIIEEGTIIMNNSIVNASCKIGKNCIINTNSLIEHDSIIGDDCHISTSSTINGECKLGNRIFLGSGSIVIQEIVIEDDTVIGAGSIVTWNLVSGTYAGNPAKPI